MTVIAAAQGSGAAVWIANLFPIAVIVLIFYFLVIAPANKQRRQTQEMLSALKKGDRVITSGGIYGAVHSIQDEIVYLKIADNVKIRVQKSSISGFEAKK